MSSNIRQAAIDIQLNNYAVVAIITAVGYDYVLTLSKEIEYIWSKPWTFVSTMFILVRYPGLCAIITICLSITLNVIHEWTFLVFFGIADFLMMLRIWAMYSRSMIILTALLVLFFLEIVATIVAVCIMSEPKNQLAVVFHIWEFSECALESTIPAWISTTVAVPLQMTYSVVLCVLAIVQFVKQALQMHRLTKGWQINRYMNLFATQGVVYFFVFILLNLISMLSSWAVLRAGWQMIPLNIMEIVPVYTLVPRFVISVRELFARDVRGGGIDTGFGLSTLSIRGAGEMMVFADDAGQNDGMGDDEEIRMDPGLGLPT